MQFDPAKNVLVTGASGFIGSTLVELLLQNNYQVSVLLRKNSSRADLPKAKINIFEGDLEDLTTLKSAVQNQEFIFHLAGVIAARSEQEFFLSNIQGTKNLAEAAQKFAPQLKRFVYVSSLAAAGPAESSIPRSEIVLPNPISTYGRSKRGGEVELEQMPSDFPYTIVRPPIVYGPRDRALLALVRVISRFRLKVILKSRGMKKKKYYSSVHVQDLCKGLLLAAESPRGRREIFFLSGQDILSFEEILEVMASELGRSTFTLNLPLDLLKIFALPISKILGRKVPFNSDKIRELEQDFWICSSKKAEDLLGYRAEYNFKEGMPETIRWYKNAGWI